MSTAAIRSATRRPAPWLARSWPVLLLLTTTAVAYLWNLSANGWGNGFYAAAAQAGSQSWTAFLFGSSDLANSITVDKAPAFLWPMDVSVKLFGLNSMALMAPEALMGVASVGLVYASVARVAGRGAGLLAGWLLAITPVAALMFRFDNPEAMLLMLTSLAAWAVVRGIESGRARWMALCGAALGLAFLTKQLQGLLVVPGFGLAWLLLARGTLRRRVLGLATAVLSLVVSAGWWIALVMLVPAEDRPYVGGSQTNSFWDLTFGYNGLGRITGHETGSVGGGATASASPWRMLDAEFGGQISWLLPAAVLLLIGGLVVTRRAARTDARRAALLVWGSWLVVTWVVFSIMQGIQHAYYSVTLAPAVAAVVGLGAGLVWDSARAEKFFTLGSEPEAVVSPGQRVDRLREAWRGGTWQFALLGGATALTGAWAFVLLHRADYLPLLQWAVLLFGLLFGAGLACAAILPRQLVLLAAVGALLVGSAGPLAFTLQTLSTGHQGSIVSAGPGAGMGGGAAPAGGSGASGGAAGPAGTTGGAQGTTSGNGGTSSNGAASSGGAGQTGGGAGAASGQATASEQGSAGGSQGGVGAMLNTSTPSAKLLSYLSKDAGNYTWMLAVVGSNNAAGYQLESGHSVMPVGGYNGTDPSPTLKEFQRLVQEKKIHYYIPGTISSSLGGGASTGSGSSGSSGTASQIDQWVQKHFASTQMDGTTVYDLTQESGS